MTFITNEQMANLVCSGNFPITVSISKEGIFLRVGDGQYEITEHQANILWEVLPTMPRYAKDTADALE